eukprot:CAMPEP_0206445938 /NCGR_PEP_ID=MMETSP0324_2-20121206/15828_1 /ASSEMBLY_ACC=CAM_ASM_000836 /TAXON_ID=2866 /ORGANISM="Crypthecodinium cohnii, Strain Seligo" /LENGTH=275 /DNA_ID=CAMNT_0053914293 /DNA_START=126 /DNA_END=953 /DNA_ORIENTATION=-
MPGMLRQQSGIEDGGILPNSPKTPGAMISAMSFLNQEKAKQVDVDLMSEESGFSIDQLMELAGLSVASALAKEYPVETHRRVLIICGPGNNGGDGLVAARHLQHFGYSPKVIYPKMESIIAKNDLYKRLTKQLGQLGIPIIDDWQRPCKGDADIIVDTIFGFSFKGFRGGGQDAPYDDIVDFLGSEEGAPNAMGVPLICVDIPSGWDVETGPTAAKALRPDMLLSLTAPKLCALNFKGDFHYLGGRFVTPAIIKKNDLQLPMYPGAEQCVRLAAI